jgi:hypothetical protein
MLKTGAGDTDNDFTPAPDQDEPLYMTLSTAPVTIGRKGCDVNFTGDKSCSRNHATIEVKRRRAEDKTVDAISQLTQGLGAAADAANPNLLSLFSQVAPTPGFTPAPPTPAGGRAERSVYPEYDESEVNEDIVIQVRRRAGDAQATRKRKPPLTTR